MQINRIVPFGKMPDKALDKLGHGSNIETWPLKPAEVDAFLKAGGKKSRVGEYNHTIARDRDGKVVWEGIETE